MFMFVSVINLVVEIGITACVLIDVLRCRISELV